MPTIDEFRSVLALADDGPDRFRGASLGAYPTVFGGQLLGQAIVAARHGHPAMAVKTLHTVFARPARPDLPLEITVEPMHAGRTFASSAVSFAQNGKLCARAVALLHAEEDDLIRHGTAPAVASTPADAKPGEENGDWEIRIVDGVDISDPDAVGPAELDVWTRFVGAPDDPAVDQALIAFATDGFLIGTAMRPHAGVGQAQAHRTLATGVVSHTITFHEPSPAAQWHLLSHRSPYAGHGRSYGHADVFDEDGRLVASFVQDAMIRAMA